MRLPEPQEAAKQHSLRVNQYLQEVLAFRGSISFHDYMHLALYAPGLGYYSAGAHKFGEAGDFVTAPEIAPAFGATLAQSLLPFHAKHYLELGAGTGKLAESILLFLKDQQKLPEQYFILEVSADLKQRQQIYLQKKLPPDIFARLAWLETLPPKFSGIILANEVLDALPIHRFKITKEGIKEFFIDAKGEFLDEPSSPYLKSRIEALHLRENYESEINLQSEALLKTLSERLTDGAICFIDYGFPAHEYYHPDRHMGTLMCHYQHIAHGNPYLWPGLQDITTHVDFTALAKCGIESGLQLLAYTTQEAWLLHHGILNMGSRVRGNDIRKLISPTEMGELFKVILFGKNLKPERGFEIPTDRRHAL